MQLSKNLLPKKRYLNIEVKNPSLEKMSNSRRTFIKQSAFTALGLGITLPSTPMASAAYTLNLDANNPDYWVNLRNAFPLDKTWHYLNNGTMGPSPFSVIEAVHKGMMQGDEFGHYSGWDLTTQKIAAFVGANQNEIALTHNTTEGINIYTWGLPLQAGDEVIVTTHEHVGNAFPWLNRQRLHGIKLIPFNPGNTAQETVHQIEQLITPKTKVIAVPHVLCSQGQILPIREISRLGKSRGLFVVVDGAHGAGMLNLNLHELGCDAYASCCHKWMLGPKGTGFLFVKESMQEVIQPYFVGGGSDDAGWNLASQPIQMGTYAKGAHRYYGGTQSLGLYQGVNASIEFLESIGMNKVADRIQTLGDYTTKGLLALGKKVEVLTPIEKQSFAGIIGFRSTRLDANTFYNKAMEQKIRIRMVAENGINCLRVSTHIYNQPANIDALLNLLDTV